MARKCLKVSMVVVLFGLIAISAISKIHAAPSGCDLRRIFQTPSDKDRRLMEVVPDDDSQGRAKSFANAQISLRFSDRALPPTNPPQVPAPHSPPPCQCNPRCHCCNPQPLSVLYAPSHLIHPLVPVPPPQPVVQQQELVPQMPPQLPPQIGVITHPPPPAVVPLPPGTLILPQFPQVPSPQQGPSGGICVGCGAPFPCNCGGYLGAGPVQGGVEGANFNFPHNNYQNGGVSGSSVPGSVISGAQIGAQDNKQVGLVNNQAVSNIATNTNTQGWSGLQDSSYSHHPRPRPPHPSDVSLNANGHPIYTYSGLTSGSGSAGGTKIGAQDNSQSGLVNNKSVVNVATSSGGQKNSQSSTGAGSGAGAGGADIGAQDNSQTGLVNNQAIINIATTDTDAKKDIISESAKIAGNVISKPIKNYVQGKLTNEKIEKKIAELEKSRIDLQKKLETIETSVKKQQQQVSVNKPAAVVVETATLGSKPPSCNSDELKINIVRKLEGYPSQTSNIKFIPVELTATHSPRERTLYKRINPLQQQLEEALVPYTPSSPLAPSWGETQKLLLSYPVFDKGSFVPSLPGSSAAGCRPQLFSSGPSSGQTVIYKKSPPPSTLVSVVGPFKGTLTRNPKSRRPTATILLEEQPSTWREAESVKRPSKIVRVVDEEEPIKTPGSDYVWTLVKGPSEDGCPKSKDGILVQEEPLKKEIVLPSIASC